MRFLIILGGGGHTAQMLRLVNLLGSRHQYEYVIEESDTISAKKIKFKGKIFRFKRTRNIKESILTSSLKQLPAFFSANKLMKQVRSDIIISCGPNFSIPIILAGKLSGKKIVFMETWSRIHRGSITGKFGYRFADLFFVQWPEMKKLYPKAIYAGRLA